MTQEHKGYDLQFLSIKAGKAYPTPSQLIDRYRERIIEVLEILGPHQYCIMLSHLSACRIDHEQCNCNPHISFENLDSKLIWRVDGRALILIGFSPDLCRTCGQPAIWIYTLVDGEKLWRCAMCQRLYEQGNIPAIATRTYEAIRHLSITWFPFHGIAEGQRKTFGLIIKGSGVRTDE